jgi:RNA polymerase sigma-70 factor (ECF subfamily)
LTARLRDVMTNETDRHYVERCLDGHRDDFRHLVLRYQRSLVAGIRVRRVPLAEAEDVAQEALVRAFSNLATLRKPDSFFAWLLGIAYRVLLERAGHERLERAGLARLAAEARSSPPAAGARPEDAALDTALEALPVQYREVILLRFYGECSCAEIAERLGVPLGTVTKRLSRAYDELRQRLAAPRPREGDRCPATHTANS